METSSSSSSSSPSISVRTAMRVSRAGWFIFTRRVFHYQNGPRSDSTPNPFNTGFWIALELAVLAAQTAVIVATLAASRKENPVWILTVWVAGYNLGNFLTLPLLYCRFRHFHLRHLRFPDVEDQRTTGDPFSSCLMMNKLRRILELFFALWFVIGSVWVFDTRFRSFDRAPRLHVLCISLLAWNALLYSFPFLLFILHCCCVPLVSSSLGYNMNQGSVDRGASDDQISRLPRWRFKAVHDCKPHIHAKGNTEEECCICLGKYMEQEEVRRLPCSHLFHLKCVDRRLRIISFCPLCKHEVER